MKQNKKKKIAVIAAIVAIIAIISAGTLAWFNDTDTKTNKFAISDGTDGDFEVRVMESSEPITDHPEAIRGTVSADGIDYTGSKIIPGSLISKKPVALNDSELDIEQWVRVLVKVPNASEWETACAKHGISDLATIFGGHDGSKWERTSDSSYCVYVNMMADTLTYAYYYKEKLGKGNQTEALFDRITIPGVFDQEDMASIADNTGNFDIVVTAHAIQATNNSATSALEAFKAVNWPLYSDAPVEE